LFLGALLAVARELTDQRFRGPQQIKAALGLPILASIPHMRGRPTAQQAGQIVQIDPGSNAAEAYRDLRTAVYFTQQHRRTKTILIASPAANDGKTTVASNLAAAFAQSGHEVLLIDADMRDPSLHDVYGLSNDIGLSRVLAGRDDAPAAIRRTAIEQLSVMTAGPCPTHPSELLNGVNFKRLLDTLGERFDYIVIDSPPVLAVTDTRIVATTTDATLLVLRPGRSNRKQAAAACESLAAVGANVMGIVANATAAAYGYAMHPYPYGRRAAGSAAAQTVRADQTHPHSIAVR
jgi:capsular exopolysaccharide synthesis family protein